MFRLSGISRLAAFVLVLGGLLVAAAPAFATMERARAAQARGDLRAAQIEFRNAVRANPNSIEARVALAQSSLDVGDTDAAEREARELLNRGYDRAAGTGLLIRALLGRGRFEEVLREFPAPAADAPPALAGQVLAGRALAELALDRRDRAREAAAQAVRLAPSAAEPNLAAARVALADNDRAAAAAALDRALAAEPRNTEALLRKGSLQYEAAQFQPALETFNTLITVMPGNVIGRTRRAEVQLRLNNLDAARQDIDFALRIAGNYTPALYIRALMQAQAQDWRGADETLTRIGGNVANFPDGLLLLASVKQQLGQAAQAEDAAQRHVARRPEDPRGVRMLAGMMMASNRTAEAAGLLERLVSRGAADLEALDMLARAYLATGRAREAAAAYDRAAALAPDNATLQARLAVSRLAAGDAAGATTAAETVLRLDPTQLGMHQVLAGAALGRGDVAAAAAALERVPPAQRDSELAGVIDGTIRLVRVDLPGARTAFETVLRNHPESVRGRLGLARAAAMQGNAEETERLFGEVLAREPSNTEAMARLSAAARSGTPRADAAMAALERAQAAAAGEPGLALVTAAALIARNNAARAEAILSAEALRPRRRGTPVLLLLAESQAAQEKWAEAEASARTALAEEPENAFARQQLAFLTLRRGDPRGAETLINVGLNAQPANPLLQQAAVQLARQERGLDAALEVADRIARQPGTRPASLALRGDLLLAAERPADAAAAFAAAFATAPSRELAARQASALLAARQVQPAADVLSAWLAREPGDTAAAAQLAQLEISLGRLAEAEQRMEAIVAAAPEDGVSLNNLAWLLQQRADATTQEGRDKLARARLMAERAYYLAPTPETSDTLGWVLARQGEAAAGLPLLRQAAAASVAQNRGDPAMFFRLAYALRLTGARDEAIRMLEPTLAPGVQFPERPEAERLMDQLRAGG